MKHPHSDRQKLVALVKCWQTRDDYDSELFVLVAATCASHLLMHLWVVIEVLDKTTETRLQADASWNVYHALYFDEDRRRLPQRKPLATFTADFEQGISHHLA